MAVYRIGDILRMKREALGITREKLCELSEEACSPQTLYRMECGKVKVKQDVYRKLMECMGELPERNYASVLVTKYQILNLKYEIQMNLVHREYEDAEKKLEELKKFMDMDYVRNKQYFLKIKSEINYQNQKNSIEEHLENLCMALRYTIPNIEKIEVEQWPYNCEEFDIIIAMAGLYDEMNQREHTEKILLQMKKNTEKRYMDKNFYVWRHKKCFVELSQLMCLKQQHKISMEYCREGVKESREQRILGNVYDLLYDLAWNKEKMIQKGIIEKKERESCKRLLVQAYYLSISQGMEHSAERIKKTYDRFYPGEVTLLL